MIENTPTEADIILDALGNQVRRDILMALVVEELPVKSLADRFPISRPAISKHLRILEEAGLIQHTAQGTSNIFRLRVDGFRSAQAYLSQFWDEALQSFKLFAENQGDETE